MLSHIGYFCMTGLAHRQLQEKPDGIWGQDLVLEERCAPRLSALGVGRMRPPFVCTEMLPHLAAALSWCQDCTIEIIRGACRNQPSYCVFRLINMEMAEYISSPSKKLLLK